MSADWSPCEWKYLGHRPFTGMLRMLLFTFPVALVLLLTIVSTQSIVGAVILLILILPPVLLFVLVKCMGKDSIIYRDMMRLPQKGDYSVARGHLFLRVPKFSQSYVKPRNIVQEDERTAKVSGRWPWQSYRVTLPDGPSCSKFILLLEGLGARKV